MGDTASDPAAQEEWLRACFRRPGDYYFLIETENKIPLGAYGIYDIQGDSAESGRWVMRPDVPAAIPHAILAFEVAFDRLKLRELRARTISTNRTVLSLNAKMGFHQTKIEPNAQKIGGQPVDQVHFVLRREDWLPRREKLLPLAEMAARQIRQWAAAQPGSQVTTSNPL
ncbi:MAG TPA: GNAT family protein [Verrucomicrobiae bacterium]|nr:GNAT family protein [Verrucomicrobiae bacterium]